ncbi:MAG: riboflavin biosynthesis protein RibF [Phycisphaerales bacterium]
MNPAARAITIGNFDGVHAGHRALLEACRARVGPTGSVVAMAFDPHPLTRLKPAAAPARLTRFQRRADLLQAAGADEVVRLFPTDDFLGMSARAFVESIVRDHKPALFVEGEDFHFGRGREGSTQTLATLGREFGFEVEVIDAVEVDLLDQHLVRASSSLVRWLLSQGRVGDAARVLGRPHRVEGRVVRGDRLGRTIGYPTLNITTDVMTPADGIYAGSATLPDGRVFPTAVSLGTRPTFDGLDRRLEAYLIGAPRDHTGAIMGLDEYGWEVSIDFLAFLRDQVKFDGIEPLVAQIERDVERTLDWTNRSARQSLAPTAHSQPTEPASA